MTPLNYLFAFITLTFSLSIFAEPTHIMIRAKSTDAKYIGTGVGGMRVVIEDAETAEILDQGWINGTTGNTKTIIEDPIHRGQMLSDEHTAGYLATVDIDHPRLIRITLIGPYGYRQSMQEATITSWIIPGKDILGDGITLNMPGFIVDGWTRVLEAGVVEIYTKASLLCGCPITKGGFWNADNYQAAAIIMQNDNKIIEVPLEFTGPIGIFSAKTNLDSGVYKAIIYLIDQSTGNVGVDRTIFEVPNK